MFHYGHVYLFCIQWWHFKKSAKLDFFANCKLLKTCVTVLCVTDPPCFKKISYIIKKDGKKNICDFDISVDHTKRNCKN